jgi:hypothetical protein
MPEGPFDCIAELYLHFDGGLQFLHWQAGDLRPALIELYLSPARKLDPYSRVHLKSQGHFVALVARFLAHSLSSCWERQDIKLRTELPFSYENS